MGSSMKKTGKNLRTTGRESQGLIALFEGSEILYKDLFNNASDAIFIHDLKGNVIEANETAAMLTGYTRNDLKRMNISGILTADSFKATVEKQKALLKDESEIQCYDLELIRKDVVSRNVELVTSLITFNGQPIGIQAIVRDITERKRAEERTRESEEKYRELVNTSIDGVVSVDAQMKITVWNQGAERIFGYTQEEILGQTMMKIIPKRYREAVGKGFVLFAGTGSGPVINKVLQLDGLKEDGTEVPIELSVSSREVGETYIATAIVRDITERKQAEEALQQSENRYRDLFENASDLIQSVTPDGNFLYVNKAWKNVLGYSDEEIANLTLWDIIHPDSMPHCVEAFQKVMSGEAIYNIEATFVAKDGKLITVEGSTSCRFEGGKPVSTRGIFHDITEREQVRETLRQSEEKLRLMFESVSDGLFVLDLNSVYTEVNQRMLEMHGFNSKDDLLGKSGLSLIAHESDIDRVKVDMQKILEQGSVLDTEYYARKKDGSEFPVEVSGTLLTDGHGNPVGFIGLTRDITERKQAEEALRESEKRFQMLAENTNDWAWEIDTNGAYTYSSPRVKELLGYEPEEVIGRTLLDFICPEEAKPLGEEIRAIVESQRPFTRLENTNLHKDGRLVVLEGSGVPFFDDDGRFCGYRGIDHDITERKKAEQELRIRDNAIVSSINAIAIADLEGNVSYVNHSFLEVWGYDNEKEVLGRNAVEFWETEEKALEVMEVVRDKGSWVDELVAKREDGSTFDVQLSANLVADEGGKPICMMASFADITERKRAMEALRESEEFNLSLLSNSPNPIVVVNPDTSLRYVNPALEEMTGFSSAELIGKKSPYLWWTEETLRRTSKNFEKALRKGARRLEELFQKKNGEAFWVEITSKAVRKDNELKYYLENWVDITEEKRLRKNMEFYVSEVTKAQEEERKRIAREIHDESIQSLVTLAHGIDAIARERGSLPENVIQHLKRLRTEADSVVVGLRRFSHELRPDVLDKVGLIPALELLAEELNGEKRINTSLDVRGSEQRLEPELELGLFRIAQEALSNVRRHSGATKAAIRILLTHKKVRLSVSDNGRGFKLPEVLNDFAASGKLGLLGMQERAHLLGGKLLVKSQVDEGTTVTVEKYVG